MIHSVKTTCPYCGVGCGVIATADSDGHVSVKGDPAHPANYGKLCSKGSALAETLSLEDRLLTPSLYGQDASWEQALDHVAEQLTATIREYGPDSVAFYVSGQLLTEDYYVANKLMKGFIGSGNIDTNSRLCMSSSVAGHKRAFGEDIVPGTYDDWDQADLAVLVGSNAAWCHPILFQRLLRNQSERDMKLIIIDPRRTPSCDTASLHLPIRPGTDVLLFNGLLVYLADNGYENSAYYQAHTTGYNDALATARADAPNLMSVAAKCDVSPDALETFYKLFATTEKTITIYSQGVNQSSQGTDKVNAIINCHFLTGRIGRPGQGPFSITGQPNAMGGREVGGLANMLAAHMDFNDEGIKVVGEFWKAPQIATKPGLKAIELFNEMAAGKVKALWVMGTNPAASVPHANLVTRALQNCPLVIVSDCMASNDTLKHAHIALPALAWGEKDGTVTNSERCISRQRSFLSPPGEAKADFWILSEVAKRMGWPDAFPYQDSADVFKEYSHLTVYKNGGQRALNLSGLTALAKDEYNHLAPVSWPLTPGTTDQYRFFSHGGFFTPDRKGRFIATRYQAPKQLTSDTYPLILNTGRLRDQWHTMTRTGKSARLNSHIREPFLSIHPHDALSYDLVDGGLVHVESQQGTAVLRCQVTDSQRKGEVFIPMHWNDHYAAQACVAKLAQNATDPHSGQPEMKYTPVQIKAWQPDWSGLLISRQDISLIGIPYWTKRLSNGCYVYQLASHQNDVDVNTLIPRLFDNFNASQIQTLQDPKQARSAHAAFQGDRLERALFSHAGTVQYATNWLENLFEKDSITAEERRGLLSGRGIDMQDDIGDLVCSCFGIGSKQIQAFCHSNPSSTVDDIGEKLKAGTNCGSCRSEIRKLLEDIYQGTATT